MEEERIRDEEDREDRKEEEIVRRLEKEEKSLDDIKRVQEELYRLNKSLNSCIAIASSSIVNVAIGKKFDYMKTANRNAFNRSNQTLDNALEETKNNINRLQEEKAIEEERRRQAEKRENEEVHQQERQEQIGQPKQIEHLY